MKYISVRSSLYAVVVIVFAFLTLCTSSYSVEKDPIDRIFLGNSKANAVSGKNVFVAAGGTILIGTIVSADSVHYLSEISLPSIVSDLKVQGSYLYAADLLQGLVIIDCTDLSAPVVVGTYSSSFRAYGVLVHGTDVYIGWGTNGISRLDATNKAKPVLLSHSPVQSENIQLLYGNLYCNTKTRLTIVHPSTLASIAVIRNGTGFPQYEIKNVVYSDFAVAVVENYFGIISPAATKHAGPSTSWGSIAYFSVENIAQPILKKTFIVNTIQSAEANGNVLYCVTADSLIRYKIYENSYIDQRPLQLTQKITRMTVNDSLLLMSTDYPGYFQIARHSGQSVITTKYFLDTRADIGSVAATDSFLVAGTESFGGLYLVDLRSKNNAKITHKYNDSTGYVRGLAILRDTVYAATEKGLKIFSVSNHSLKLVGGLDYGNLAWCIDIEKTLVAIGGYYNDVHLIDVSDKMNPKYLSFIDIPNGAVVEDIQLQDSVLYITGRYTGLYAYNIANPKAPELIWWKNLGNGDAVYPDGNRLFTGDGNILRVYSIANVKTPEQLDTVTLPGNVRSVKILSRDTLVYVTFFSNGYTENNGLLVYRMNAQGKLSLVSIAYTPGWPNDLAHNTDNLFMSDDLDGVYVYALSSLMTTVASPSVRPLLQTFTLHQNYPNPFNPSTTIAFYIPAKSQVVLRIYDLLGREVTTLINEELQQGDHTAAFNAEHLSSGVYYFHLSVGGSVQNKKMVLIK
ncbi:MAG: T9SS type A sorting domain-containing protein [Bacteriovoracaceae bacterium]